jgi:UDP-N-acetylglucosamine/UDP-N-acetylgalactosamine diphosphorylase
MVGELPDKLRGELTRHGQEQVLRLWDALGPAPRERMLAQLQAVDFEQLKTLVASRQKTGAADQDALVERSRRAMPPQSMVRLPKTADDRGRWEKAHEAGEKLLRAGKVAAILVAGGQGTRLGFDKPKGMFPIGLLSQAPLFQVLAHQLLARSRRAGAPIPYFVMTSDATHEDTVTFFREHNYFGLPAGDVFFFQQANMPAVDAETGKLLISDDQSLTTSPDGHGGMLTALAKSGHLAEMRRRGIEYIHYHQVDNPTAIVCDPVFLGFHSQLGCDMSVKVVAKKSAEERMGVAVDVDSVTQIIEYSDLPLDVARKTDATGSLLLWAGSTAIHVFTRAFLDRLVAHGDALPFHVAHKKVPYCDAAGKLINPTKENAYKFERFIFDALPLAKKALVLETDRAREFNPVKNATGDDSPETAQRALARLYHDWLRSAGAEVDDSTPVEISPLFAVDGDEVRARVRPGTKISSPTNFQ